MFALQFDFQHFAWNRPQRQGENLGKRKRLPMFIGLARVVMVAVASTTSTMPRIGVRGRKERGESGKQDKTAIQAHELAMLPQSR